MLALASTDSSSAQTTKKKGKKNCTRTQNKWRAGKSSKMWLWIEAVLDCGNGQSSQHHIFLQPSPKCASNFANIHCKGEGGHDGDHWDSTQHNALPVESSSREKVKQGSHSYQLRHRSLTLCGIRPPTPFFQPHVARESPSARHCASLLMLSISMFTPSEEARYAYCEVQLLHAATAEQVKTYRIHSALRSTASEIRKKPAGPGKEKCITTPQSSVTLHRTTKAAV